ncbi:hypothetical protein XENOCAPTIV_017783 [Xenoophorus captivus]|uniref:5'-nucleotidase n=1 Tax=Xenoophorus captivus TaxID=1517983 RepID=A0ABV0QNE7_9TELE
MNGLTTVGPIRTDRFGPWKEEGRQCVSFCCSAGSITMEDLLSVLPFGGTFDLVQLNGSTLREAFEHAVRKYGKNSGEFLQVMLGCFTGLTGPCLVLYPPPGLHVEFDVSKSAGRRVRSLSILCTRCRVPQYEPVRDKELYTVVVPSYLVTGGDGFEVIKNGIKKHNSGENSPRPRRVNRF